VSALLEVDDIAFEGRHLRLKIRAFWAPDPDLARRHLAEAD